MYKSAQVHAELPHACILEMGKIRFLVKSSDIEEGIVAILRYDAEVQKVYPLHAPKHPSSFTTTHREVKIPNVVAEKITELVERQVSVAPATS